MKFRTFRAILLVLGALALGAGGFFWIRALDSAEPQRPSADAPKAPTAPGVPQPAGDAAPSPAGPQKAAAPGESAPLRSFDKEILALSTRSVPGDKIKDAVKGRSYKVNLYRDAGNAQANRLKVDLDRDDKWDEKWDFERTGSTLGVKRQVAPADDERYTEEYRLTDGAWVRHR